MISLLSPAKTLDFESARSSLIDSSLEFGSDAKVLAGKLKRLSSRQLSKMMSINPDLAQLNKTRYDEWTMPGPGNGKQAALVFRGDVYRGFDANSLTDEDLSFAQDHVRILSGLYGILKPMDLILPYRLEMGTSWKITPAKKNLYVYWKDRLAEHILKDLDDGVIVNLASNEYFKAVKNLALSTRIVTCHFRDLKNGEYKSLMTYAKLGRGYMTRYIVQNRINSVEDLKSFDSKKYTFNDRLSSDSDFVFTRDEVEL
jgi:cytoplasmic iron level regulating protein YaaA (DUF328/UPF0246 family)